MLNQNKNKTYRYHRVVVFLITQSLSRILNYQICRTLKSFYQRSVIFLFIKLNNDLCRHIDLLVC